jgi:hypothetical protein
MKDGKRTDEAMATTFVRIGAIRGNSSGALHVRSEKREGPVRIPAL